VIVATCSAARRRGVFGLAELAQKAFAIFTLAQVFGEARKKLVPHDARLGCSLRQDPRDRP